MTFEDPNTRQARTVTAEAALGELLAAPADELLKADALIAFADAVYGSDTVQAAYDALDEALIALPGDEDLVEVRELLGKAD